MILNKLFLEFKNFRLFVLNKPLLNVNTSLNETVELAEVELEITNSGLELSRVFFSLPNVVHFIYSREDQTVL